MIFFNYAELRIFLWNYACWATHLVCSSKRVAIRTESYLETLYVSAIIELYVTCDDGTVTLCRGSSDILFFADL